MLQVFKAYPLCQDYERCIAHAINDTTDILPHNISAMNISATETLPGNRTSITMTTMLPDDDASPDWKVIEDFMQPNTALLTMTLTLFTFVLAYAFKGLRNKKLLGRTVSGT